MRGYPVARGALCRGDLRLRHLGGDLTTQSDCVLVAQHGREVEPLVRGDEVDRERASDRAAHPELKEIIAGVIAARRRFAFQMATFVTLHVDLPSRSQRTRAR